jgi:hypothetical protein
MSPRDANARLPSMSGSGPKRPATYEDLLEVPDNRLDGDSWRLVTSVAGPVRIAAEPFEAIEIDLAREWAR